jgi:phosphopantothenoylcysteine decarboxylase/phosphopantothenate--cysteine ligase
MSARSPLHEKTVLLGVTGSIAAYKAAELASRLAQSGARVDVILTQAALQFVTPLTFQSVTGRKAYIDADLWGGEGHVTHIGLGRAGDVLVIAPASANTIAKLAHGIGDNLLSVTALASYCPLVIAPAMDAGMYDHPATQANVAALRQRGAVFLGPASGHLASGLKGVGRMVEPADILAHVCLVLARSGPLAGRRVVVTAGGTQEPIDPVRVITNRSSGKQGYALAQAALEAGAEVTLISAPTQLPLPVGARHISVTTTEEMLRAVLEASPEADALLMAAAPADFRPVAASGQKIKKESGVPQVILEPTPDILTTLAGRTDSQRPRVVIGFAAETQDLLEAASRKLSAKRLDMIVANDVSAPGAGFEVETNRVTFLSAQGGQETLPLMSKSDVAEAIIERLICLLEQKAPRPR